MTVNVDQLGRDRPLPAARCAIALVGGDARPVEPTLRALRGCAPRGYRGIGAAGSTRHSPRNACRSSDQNMRNLISATRCEAGGVSGSIRARCRRARRRESAPRSRSPCCPLERAGSETRPCPTFCNSIRNADAPAGTAHLVRVTHPFHPLSGRQFACVGERYNRYGKRLLLQVDAGTVCSVPPQWTDVVVPDPAIAIGKRRAVFRVADLMELAQLVADLSRHAGRSGPNERKVNSAATVKKIRRTKEPESARQAKPSPIGRRRRR